MKDQRGIRFMRATVLALPALLLTQLSAAEANPTASGSLPGDEPVLWLAGPIDDSFPELVAEAVHRVPAQREVARAVLGALATKAAAGVDVTLAGSMESDAAGDLVQIQAALQGLDRVSGGLGKPSGTPHLRGGPTDFELRGVTINDTRSWSVRTEFAGGPCGLSGCTVTDRVRTTWTITPGRTGDKFEFTSIYSPKTGLFEQIYADVFAYRKVGGNETFLNAEQAGEGGARDGSGSGSQIVTHGSQAGLKTIDKVRMMATFRPWAQRLYDGVRTGTATCGTGSTYACFFV